ncbi:hypothetical protein R9C05_00215 [Metamycoplasma subdolum]|uniref:hypothetical protein n=1 Tax=Metamycoplasma subdolum TaxID=92407 RepID=UPI00298C77D2|nr:hypothetical protein [Metamycoplasma subdolum]WPB50576.1 hypothetical protein R9C05_00215 [Metamycoplasma subdolum]
MAKEKEEKNKYSIDKIKPTDKIDFNNLFKNPTQDFYTKVAKEYENSFNKVLKEITGGKEEKIYEERVDKINTNIQDFRGKIEEKRKELKINARKFANAIIIIFCFLIIGLFFLPFLIKNNKIIKEFNEFTSNQEAEIKKSYVEKGRVVFEFFGGFNLEEMRNLVLKTFNFYSIPEFDSRDFFIVSQLKGFIGFDLAEKFDFRNSYIYNVLYKELEFQNIITKGSKTITYYVGDELITKTVYAQHVEKTPFIYQRQALVVPTNYLPELSFRYAPGVSEKEIKRRKTKGIFTLEDEEFYNYYDFQYNSNLAIPFAQYFNVLTQKNMIEYEKFVREKEIEPLRLQKIKNWLFATRPINDFSEDLININWVSTFIIAFPDKNLNGYIQTLKNAIWQLIQPLINMITLTYTNKNIASESFEGLGKRYLSTFADLEEIGGKEKIQSNIVSILNDYFTSKVFNFNQKHDKPIYVSSERVGDFSGRVFVQDIRLNSYYGKNEIDYVSTGGTTVEVPFVKFYPNYEDKKSFFTSNFRFSNPNAYMKVQPKFRGKFNFGHENQLLSEIIQEYGVMFNNEALKNQAEFEDTLYAIKRIFDEIKAVKDIAVME